MRPVRRVRPLQAWPVRRRAVRPRRRKSEAERVPRDDPQARRRTRHARPRDRPAFAGRRRRQDRRSARAVPDQDRRQRARLPRLLRASLQEHAKVQDGARHRRGRRRGREQGLRRGFRRRRRQRRWRRRGGARGRRSHRAGPARRRAAGSGASGCEEAERHRGLVPGRGGRASPAGRRRLHARRGTAARARRGPRGAQGRRSSR